MTKEPLLLCFHEATLTPSPSPKGRGEMFKTRADRGLSRLCGPGDCPDFRGARDTTMKTDVVAAKMGLSPLCG
jgi:hypothetical protein